MDIFYHCESVVVRTQNARKPIEKDLGEPLLAAKYIAIST
jgi:hypothetical protein